MKEWAPALGRSMVREATPEALVEAEPRAVAPSRNWTEPVGWPAPGATAEELVRRVLEAEAGR